MRVYNFSSGPAKLPEEVASIYNAMPVEGVRALVDFMQDFERRHG